MIRPRTLVLTAFRVPFIRNLSYSFFGGIFFGLANVFFFVLWGRALGPEKFTLLSILFFSLPFLASLITRGEDMGFLKYFSEIPADSRREYLQGLGKRVIWGYIVFLSLYFIFYWQRNVFIPLDFLNQIEPLAWEIAPLVVVAVLIKNFSDAYLRSESLFAWQGMGRIGEAAFLLFPFFFFSQKTLAGAFLSLIVSYLFVGTWGFCSRYFLIRKKSFSETSFPMQSFESEVRMYGLYAMLSAVATFLLMSFDKFFLGSQIGLEQAGIYSAYFIVTVAPLLLLQTMLINVFFPWVNRQQDKKNILRKLNFFSGILFLPIVSMTFFGGSILIFLFGKAYVYQVSLMFLFSLYAYIFSVLSLRQWLLASRGPSGLLIASSIAIFLAFSICLILSFGNSLTWSLVGMNIVATVAFIVSGNQKFYR